MLSFDAAADSANPFTTSRPEQHPPKDDQDEDKAPTPAGAKGQGQMFDPVDPMPVGSVDGRAVAVRTREQFVFNDEHKGWG